MDELALQEPAEGDIFEVESIIDYDIAENGKKYFRVRWKGYGSDDDTWEPYGNLLTCDNMVKDFMRMHKKKKKKKRKKEDKDESKSKPAIPDLIAPENSLESVTSDNQSIKQKLASNSTSATANQGDLLNMDLADVLGDAAGLTRRSRKELQRIIAESKLASASNQTATKGIEPVVANLDKPQPARRDNQDPAKDKVLTLAVERSMDTSLGNVFTIKQEQTDDKASNDPTAVEAHTSGSMSYGSVTSIASRNTPARKRVLILDSSSDSEPDEETKELLRKWGDKRFSADNSSPTFKRGVNMGRKTRKGSSEFPTGLGRKDRNTTETESDKSENVHRTEANQTVSMMQQDGTKATERPNSARSQVPSATPVPRPAEQGPSAQKVDALKKMMNVDGLRQSLSALKQNLKLDAINSGIKVPRRDDNAPKSDDTASIKVKKESEETKAKDISTAEGEVKEKVHTKEVLSNKEAPVPTMRDDASKAANLKVTIKSEPCTADEIKTNSMQTKTNTMNAEVLPGGRTEPLKKEPLNPPQTLQTSQCVVRKEALDGKAPGQEVNKQNTSSPPITVISPKPAEGTHGVGNLILIPLGRPGMGRGTSYSIEDIKKRLSECGLIADKAATSGIRQSPTQNVPKVDPKNIKILTDRKSERRNSAEATTSERTAAVQSVASLVRKRLSIDHSASDQLPHEKRKTHPLAENNTKQLVRSSGEFTDKSETLNHTTSGQGSQTRPHHISSPPKEGVYQLGNPLPNRRGSVSREVRNGDAAGAQRDPRRAAKKIQEEQFQRQPEKFHNVSPAQVQETNKVSEEKKPLFNERIQREDQGGAQNVALGDHGIHLEFTKIDPIIKEKTQPKFDPGSHKLPPNKARLLKGVRVTRKPSSQEFEAPKQDILGELLGPEETGSGSNLNSDGNTKETSDTKGDDEKQTSEPLSDAAGLESEEELELDMDCVDLEEEGLLESQRRIYHDFSDKLRVVQPIKLTKQELKSAVINGRLDRVLGALAANCNPDMLDAESDYSMLMLSIACENRDIARALLWGGADPNHQTQDGTTALMLAVEKGDRSLISSLVMNGVFIDSQKPNGESALTIACKKGFPDVVVLLLNYGADAKLLAPSPAMPSSVQQHSIKAIIDKHNERLRELMEHFLAQFIMEFATVVKPAVLPCRCLSPRDNKEQELYFEFNRNPCDQGISIVFLCLPAEFHQDGSIRIKVAEVDNGVKSVSLNGKKQCQVIPGDCSLYILFPNFGQVNHLCFRTVETKYKLLVAVYAVQLKNELLRSMGLIGKY